MNRKLWRAITLQSWSRTITLAFGKGVRHGADQCISFRFKRDRDRRDVHKTFVSACLSFACRIDRQPCAFERALARQKIARSYKVTLLKSAARISKSTFLKLHFGLNNTVTLLHFRLAC